MSVSGECQRINRTAVVSYQTEGPGAGAEAHGLEYLTKWGVPLNGSVHALEIGFGGGGWIKAMRQCCARVSGVDIARAAYDAQETTLNLHVLDVSHDPLPLPDDDIHVVSCTETIEHVANPFHMFAEIKRVLVHGGHFLIAFPRPEDNLGYDCGMHAHVYPGFLERASFERFCRQCYFKVLQREENGATAWYLLKNYKGEGVTDVFKVVSGNNTEEGLYGCLTDF